MMIIWVMTFCVTIFWVIMGCLDFWLAKMAPSAKQAMDMSMIKMMMERMGRIYFFMGLIG